MPPSFAAEDGLTILKQACQRYASAKTFHIESVDEETTTTPLSKEWHKSYTTAIQGDGNRFRFEVRSSSGSTVRVSDGKKESVLHIEDKAYTEHPVSPDGPAVGQSMSPSDLEEFHSFKIREALSGYADDYQAAELLPEETLTLDGHAVPCYVLKLTEKDRKKAPKPGSVVDERMWIAKDGMTIRQIVSHFHGPNMFSSNIFQDTDSVVQYPVVELDAKVKDNVFAFNPPAEAKLVEKFRDPLSLGGDDLTGQNAPTMKFQFPGGNEISLGEGKPVLVDFWATWCLPCVASMPEMQQLYEQTKDKGLAFMSVDEDKDAKTATDFLAKKKIPWPNLHDSGDIAKILQENGLPYTILIDAKGKIVFCKTGYSDDNLSELRAAIAGLGPEYASVTKAKSN